MNTQSTLEYLYRNLTVLYSHSICNFYIENIITMVPPLQFLCKLIIIKHDVDYGQLPTSLQEELHYLKKCDRGVYFPYLYQNAIHITRGVYATIIPYEGNVVLTSSVNEREFDCTFSLPQSTFSIYLMNMSSNNMLYEIYNGIHKLGKYVVTRDDSFILTAATFEGKQFRFDATMPTVIYPDNTTSNQLIFSVVLEKEIPQGEHILVECPSTGRRYYVNISLDCTILDLKRCLTEYTFRAFELEVSVTKEELETILGYTCNISSSTTFIDCENHNTLRFYNIGEKRVVYMRPYTESNIAPPYYSNVIPPDSLCRGVNTHQVFEFYHYFVKCKRSHIFPFIINLKF